MPISECQANWQKDNINMKVEQQISCASLCRVVEQRIPMLTESHNRKVDHTWRQAKIHEPVARLPKV